VLPEPTSKGIAAAVTIVLVGYVGVHTLYTLGRGWSELIDRADAATTFDGLKDAGDNFARVMGVDNARILVMVATATAGSGLTQLAKLVPTLPGATQASQLALVDGSLPMESVGAVQAVKIAKDGLTISLETGAVLASSIATGAVTSGTGAPSVAGVGDLPAIGPKIARQMGPRGWTPEKIREAISSGERIPATNKANGNLAIRYVHPVTGQSVVVDTVTNEVIHVGGPGFKYGPESGDLP
jgi:hypothetical protein